MTFQSRPEPDFLNPTRTPESMTSADLNRALAQMFNEGMPQSVMNFFKWMFELPTRYRLGRNPNQTVRIFKREYAVECFNVNEKTIRRWINKLFDEGWINKRISGRAYLIYLHKSPRKYRKK